MSPQDRKSCIDVDECAKWGNKCPHQCHNVKGAYKCQCDPGFQDASQGKGNNCKAKSRPTKLLFAVGHEIRQFNPEVKQYDYSDAVIAGQRIQAFDYDPDPAHNLIYWTDSSLKTIQRAAMPTRDGESGYPDDLRIDVQQPSGLAFDWVAKVLYWTDSSRGAMYLATEDGRYRKMLFQEVRFEPVSIVVNPRNGWMYWTNVFPQNPKIEASWMNGANRTVLVSTRLGKPSGITIDFRMNDRIYWCDTKENLIESMNSDGTDRVVVVSAGLNNPFNLDVFESSLYWVSMKTGQVTTMDKFGRGVNQTVQSGLLMPHDIKVYHQLRYDLTIKNRCKSKGCWPLCVLIPDGAECVCPDYSNFVSGSSTVCNAPHEPERQLPQKCMCQHGYCPQGQNSQKELKCVCLDGYHGDHCQYSPTELKSSSRTLAIVLPICLIIVLASVIILAFLFWRQRR